MIEIILLIFLSQVNGKTAKEKGLVVWKWRLATVLCWIALEIPAVVISYLYTKNVFTASISGLLAGLLGYFLVKTKLDKVAQQPKEEAEL